MKYIKKFQNNTTLETYKKSNFVAPHIYLDSNLHTVKYMEEYQQLEYISSTQTGGQYIDLGCKLFENTDDIRIDIKFNMKGGGKDYNETSGTNQTKPSVLIGSISEADPYYGFVHDIISTAANEAEGKVAPGLLREDDTVVYGDAGYLKMDKYVTDGIDREYKINRQRGTFKRRFIGK